MVDLTVSDDEGPRKKRPRRRQRLADIECMMLLGDEEEAGATICHGVPATRAGAGAAAGAADLGGEDLLIIGEAGEVRGWQGHTECNGSLGLCFAACYPATASLPQYSLVLQHAATRHLLP